jgi:hypothetical protein
MKFIGFVFLTIQKPAGVRMKVGSPDIQFLSTASVVGPNYFLNQDDNEGLEMIENNGLLVIKASDLGKLFIFEKTAHFEVKRATSLTLKSHGRLERNEDVIFGLSGENLTLAVGDDLTFHTQTWIVFHQTCELTSKRQNSIIREKTRHSSIFQRKYEIRNFMLNDYIIFSADTKMMYLEKARLVSLTFELSVKRNEIALPELYQPNEILLINASDTIEFLDTESHV